MICLVLIGYYSRAENIIDLLPTQADLPDWKLESEPGVYVGDDLFLLINGGADIYHEYGFDKVVSANYTDPFQNRIQAEIYQMNEDEAAYGIFSLMQQSKEWSSNAFGLLSVTTSDYIAFWKSKYYVIFSWSSRQHIDKPMLEKIAAIVDGKISENGQYPALVNHFEPNGVQNRKVYIKGNLGLSNFYYFDYKNIFNFKEGLAYSTDQYHVILFKYPDAGSASDKLAGARQNISSNKRFSDVANAFQGFTCADNKGNFIQVRGENNFIIVIVRLDKDLVLAPVLEDVVKEVLSIPQK